MKRCDKCNITIETNQQYCPLCHQVLKGETKPDFKELYPEHISARRMVLPTTKKALMYVTLASVMILTVINIATYNGLLWCLIPIGAIIYCWFLVRVGVLSRRNIAFRLALLTVLLIGLLIGIDYRSAPEDNGWAINYLMPLLLLSCNLAISMITWIRVSNYRDYFLYFLLILIFSLVPLILVFTKTLSVVWPALSSFGLAMAILLFIIIFFPKSIKEEIQKRFHA